MANVWITRDFEEGTPGQQIDPDFQAQLYTTLAAMYSDTFARSGSISMWSLSDDPLQQTGAFSKRHQVTVAGTPRTYDQIYDETYSGLYPDRAAFDALVISTFGSEQEFVDLVNANSSVTTQYPLLGIRCRTYGQRVASSFQGEYNFPPLLLSVIPRSLLQSGGPSNYGDPSQFRYYSVSFTSFRANSGITHAPNISFYSTTTGVSVVDYAGGPVPFDEWVLIEISQDGNNLTFEVRDEAGVLLETYTWTITGMDDPVMWESTHQARRGPIPGHWWQDDPEWLVFMPDPPVTATAPRRIVRQHPVYQ